MAEDSYEHRVNRCNELLELDSSKITEELGNNSYLILHALAVYIVLSNSDAAEVINDPLIVHMTKAKYAGLIKLSPETWQNKIGFKAAELDGCAYWALYAGIRESGPDGFNNSYTDTLEKYKNECWNYLNTSPRD